MGAAPSLALDGSAVRIDGDIDLAMPAASRMLVTLGGGVGNRTLEFMAGVPEQARWAATDVVGAELGESFSCQGGTLHVGTGSTPGDDGSTAPFVFGAWEGEHHSVGVQDYGVTDAAGMVELFEAFALEDVAHGLVLTPRRDEVALTDIPYPPSVSKRVPDLGIIEVFPITPRNVKSIPRWQGAQTAGGELFLGGSEGREHLLLAARSAIATISPQPDIEIGTVAEALDSLTVDWTRGADG